MHGSFYYTQFFIITQDLHKMFTEKLYCQISIDLLSKKYYNKKSKNHVKEFEMISLLSRLFIKNNTNYDNPKVRTGYGILCGVVGIFLNILLFSIKILAGIFSRSIAITADAFNNLSDAGSSLITLFGFRLAGSKADTDHPYGHGRMEYLSGLFVSVLIIYMGIELLTSSVNRILKPEVVSYSIPVFVILLLSICIKGYMFFFNRFYGNKIQSAALKATGTDSLGDMLSTAAVLVCSVLSHYFSIHLEGYCGVLVGILILYAGYQAAREMISPLLGKAPDPELVDRIRHIVLSDDGVLGIHDLMVHDYGPGRMFISLHAEVPADGDMLALHDSIDNIERTLGLELNCEAVIHMDPIRNKDAETIMYKENLQNYLATLSDRISLHDFRIVKGPTHTKLIFDVLSPYDSPISDEELLINLKKHIASLEGDFYGVITLDKI